MGGAQVTGTVASIDLEKKQIVLDLPDKVQVTVTTGERLQIVRRLEVGLDQVAIGNQFTAFGQFDDNQVLQAGFAGVGDLGGLFGGFGGPFGGFGGAGGPFGGAGPRRGGRQGGGAP